MNRDDLMNFAMGKDDEKTIIQISYHIEDGKVKIDDNTLLKKGTGNVLHTEITYLNIGNVEHTFNEKELNKAWIDWYVEQL